VIEQRSPPAAPAPRVRHAKGTIARLAALPAWLLTAVLGLAYLIVAPASPDLAAATYRSALFGEEGLTLWDNSWYGGHHLLAYSLFAPALGWLVSPRVVVAVSMTAAAALFEAILGRERMSTTAGHVAAVWFAWGAAVSLLSARVPFDLGLAVGLGALLAALRRRRALALVLALACSLASPVAGAFLALAFVAWALAGPERVWLAALAGGALLPIAALTIAFPEGGTQPFVASAFYPALLGVLAVGALFPTRWRALRIGTILYALAFVACYVVASPVGGNIDRLGALAGGPLAALAATGAPRRSWRRWALLALALPLLYWQANAPVADYEAAASDPATTSGYYRPLLDELSALGALYGQAHPARIEVVPLADHWEARYVGPHAMLARGWERQLDTLRDSLFYEPARPLTAARYRGWLDEQSVSLIALSDARPDYSADEESALLRGSAVRGAQPATGRPPAYLRLIWRSRDWLLFAVANPVPLAQTPATLTVAGHASFTLSAPARAAYTVRLHFTPYWAVLDSPGACVERAPGDWTRVRVPRSGSVRVGISFSLTRVFDHGPRCA